MMNLRQIIRGQNKFIFHEARRIFEAEKNIDEVGVDGACEVLRNIRT